jgi:hypothetical protein
MWPSCRPGTWGDSWDHHKPNRLCILHKPSMDVLVVTIAAPMHTTTSVRSSHPRCVTYFRNCCILHQTCFYSLKIRSQAYLKFNLFNFKQNILLQHAYHYQCKSQDRLIRDSVLILLPKVTSYCHSTCCECSYPLNSTFSDT